MKNLKLALFIALIGGLLFVFTKADSYAKGAVSNTVRTHTEPVNSGFPTVPPPSGFPTMPPPAAAFRMMHQLMEVN